MKKYLIAILLLICGCTNFNSKLLLQNNSLKHNLDDISIINKNLPIPQKDFILIQINYCTPCNKPRNLPQVQYLFLPYKACNVSNQDSNYSFKIFKYSDYKSFINPKIYNDNDKLYNEINFAITSTLISPNIMFKSSNREFEMWISLGGKYEYVNSFDLQNSSISKFALYSSIYDLMRIVLFENEYNNEW